VECGWREELKAYCKGNLVDCQECLNVHLKLLFLDKEYIQSKGLEQVSVEQLIQDLTPHGRGKFIGIASRAFY
jgi:hypothetical protein